VADLTPRDEPTAEAVNYFSFPNHPRLRAIESAASVRSRRNRFDHFMKAVKPQASDLVLDVGVTPDTTRKESNFFEELYPHRDRLTASSVEDASNLENHYPGVRFVRTKGVVLPFDDLQFDVAFSSAVIEHVGDRLQQQRFVSELLRVARCIYILTPSRWFPIDPHTMLPLIHWLPQRYHQQLLRILNQDFWATTEHLNLLSARSLRALFPLSAGVEITALRTLGWPSNLCALADRR
jgi:SAM-dependent methyltransferase